MVNYITRDKVCLYPAANLTWNLCLPDKTQSSSQSGLIHYFNSVSTPTVNKHIKFLPIAGHSYHFPSSHCFILTEILELEDNFLGRVLDCDDICHLTGHVVKPVAGDQTVRGGGLQQAVQSRQAIQARQTWVQCRVMLLFLVWMVVMFRGWEGTANTPVHVGQQRQNDQYFLLQDLKVS